MKRTCAFMLALVTALAMSAASAATVQGVVEDADGTKVGGATVWLVPAADVATMAKSPLVVKRDSTNDEPLEDSLASNRERYQKAVSEASGVFSIAEIPQGRFFVYVEPAGDLYLPGGSHSRKAMTTEELSVAPVTVKVSGNTPSGATYVGSTKCLKCHEKQEPFTGTLHRLGIRVIGKDGKLQDYARFPDFNKGLDQLMAGTKFWFHGFDKKRSFDKYLISANAPKDMASASFTATFFKDGDGKLKFRTENLRDPSDPPRVYPVEMTYGGGLYKQRYLYRVGQNLFPFVQFNQMGDASGDRTRKPWRDYHADWLFKEETGKLSDPPQAKSFDKECAACHYPGFTLTKTAQGDYVAGSVNDRQGEWDIDGDGTPNEINLGCESCHGPGSVHAKSEKSASIVSPGKLSSERATTLCVQCHSRPQGSMDNDAPVDQSHKMLPPGASRNEYLRLFTKREDAADKDFWADGVHSKSHHQQGTDFIRSSKYRNGRHLVACADCHEPHGKAEFAHQRKTDSKSEEACNKCHEKKTDMAQHVAKTTGCTVPAGEITCSACHNPRTMQTGAGMGKGMVGPDGKPYWMNDITSHLFDVPRKDNKGVKGVESAKAMPIPYTHACGSSCHLPDKL
ncbi:MAG: hypothetical protein H7831_04930 [Magnetococcus sp. WYHC-3]